MDLTETIAPRSDQANAEDFLTGPRTVTITEVRKGASPEQPVDIVLDEFGPGRPFKPSKTVRRILVAAWGAEAANYTGRRMTLYRDPSVRFGGSEVGGIRVSHLSHIDKPLTLALTETRGKRAKHVVQPLKDEPTPVPDAAEVHEYIRQAEAAQTLDEWRAVWKQAQDAGHLTPALKAKLTPIGEALKAAPQSFPPAAAEDTAPPVGDADEQADDWPPVNVGGER